MGRKKIFWNDEIYSWFLLSDPSFLHMWEAFSDQINNTPPLYFLIGWLWAQIFGDSALSLRLFSALGIFTALVLIWFILRRYYDFWPVAIGLAMVFCTSQLIMEQNTEARMYGLYLATAALALFVYDCICRTLEPRNKLLLINFLAHAALIHTHLHGAFYSGTLLVALIVYDFFFKKLSLKVYLTIVGSWFTILLYLPAFFVQIGVSKPQGWLPEPVVGDLINLLLWRNTFLNYNSLFLLILITALGYILIPRTQNPIGQNKKKLEDTKHLLLAALSWVVVPIGVYLLSKIMQPIFWSRYFMPTALGIGIILVHSLHPIIKIMGLHGEDSPKSVFFLKRSMGYRIFVLLLFLFFLTIIWIPLKNSISFKQNPRLAESSIIIKNHSDLPVVCQFSYFFWENHFYDPQPEKFYFILDEEGALAGKSGMFGAQEFKHMTAFLRKYPEHLHDQVVESETFLSRFDRFIVMDYLDYDKTCPEKVKGLKKAESWNDMHCPQWMENKILQNPEYRVTEVEQNKANTFLLVERVKK
ncbi:glycosyltransferase family 39 protein [Aquiflexum sp. TKW24L]|uniref:glycosyltransferase family 39 protein n=1 Tax=Aquiflexum sp. TKW24L TaxID=2942212 RepID=UPI0020BDA1C0|nr:glycosyltransferase family 39 protein [Aquiflexum sp. TKW24L]MCL6260625.1 glycosyltransferase family 39 protein [Aquiflexum sp. TKW24L]